MRTSSNAIITALIIVSLLPFAARAADTDNALLAARLAAAKPGDVITLEAGTYEVGDLKIPSGVSLRGAGFNKTILDAKGHKDGLTITDDSKVVISDLAVRNARESGISIQESSGLILKRLMISSNLTGLMIDNVKDGRIENVVAARNRTGATFSGNMHTALVNCSFVDNTALALALAHNQSLAVFNNVMVNSPTGIYLAKGNDGLILDHNLYFASFLGKMEGETVRTSISGWQRLTGMDSHSLSMPVEFADATQDDYRPASTLAWAPNLVTTAGWGVGSLGGFDAPAEDILGQNRGGAADLGAYVVNLQAPRKPDGAFTIAHEEGVKSAALYDARGIQVAMLFQNLPLAAGRHEFWVPFRDSWNRVLPAGSYEVRLVESQLNNPYLGLAGTFNPTADVIDGCSYPEEQFAFDAQDRIYVLQDAFENGTGIRAYDPAYKDLRWMMPGGNGTVGSTVDGKDLYFLQWNYVTKDFNLRKINLETGLIEPIAPGHPNRIISGQFSSQTYGMAFLKGRLYVSDPTNGKVFYADAADPNFTQSFAVPGALCVTADEKNGLLWVINAEGKLSALDPTSGALKPTDLPTPGIKRISANNGRLAVLSTKTGKIDIYDISDPQQPKFLRSIGSGDGPNGPQKPDRFWFQEPQTHALKFDVALNSKGAVAVVDDHRISFWDADGSLKKQGLGFWGQHNYLGRFAGADDVRVWSYDSPYCIKMDSKNKRWLPDTRWHMPGYDYDDRSMRNIFSTGGKNFGIYQVHVGDPAKTTDGKLQIAPPMPPKGLVTALLVVRFDDREAVPVSLYYSDSTRKTLVELHDTNHDGVIDAQDEVKEIRKANGSSVGIPGDRYSGQPWDASGDMVYAGSGQIVKMTGLDPTGNWPVYDWASAQSLPSTFDGMSPQMISPYDYKTKETLKNSVQFAKLSDGGYASAVYLLSSGGTGLGNGAGTDIAGFNKDGLLRWLYRCNMVEGCEGVQSVPEFNLVMGMTTKECDYMVMDDDGLGLGMLSMPKEAHWKGMWSDHAQQQQAYVGNDGQPYYLLGDYAANGFHWFAITGMEKTTRQRIPVPIDADEAALLAAGPESKPIVTPKPVSTKVTIHHLAQPFPIDGDLKKWRDAGIEPIALVTPETGSADITGPQDCSAVIRMAYQGNDLYVQTIVFRQQVSFFQPVDKLYQQDGIEMAINGFMEGFKYNVSIAADKGPVIYRNRFVGAKMDRLYTPDQAPRSIKVLDNAKDVEERHLIEAVYGVDLSNCKVVVTEFKLPLTPEVGLDGDPGLVTVAPGKSFWLGFCINANDLPGGDVQKSLVWPATYGTFNLKEAGALATFE